MIDPIVEERWERPGSSYGQAKILSAYIAAPAKIESFGPQKGYFTTTCEVSYRYLEPNGVGAHRVDRIDAMLGRRLNVDENTTVLINPDDNNEVRLLITLMLVECV